MDDYWSQVPKVFTLIKIMAGLLISAVLVGLVLVFTLKIFETVSFQSGQIWSRNAPVVYRSPMEAELVEVSVQEGELVQQGDTLLVLKNEILLAAYLKANENYWLSLANINLMQKQINNLESKVVALEKQGGLIDSDYRTQNSSHEMELSSLEQQISNLQESNYIAESRLKKDEELLEEGLLSMQTYQERYLAFLTQKNNLTDLEKQYNLRKSSRKGLGNTHSELKQEWKLRILANDYEYVSLKKALLEEEARNQEEENSMVSLLHQLEQLTIVADLNGSVSSLLNTHQLQNFIPKGTSLITLTPPEEEAFFAKVAISQEGVSKVATGQKVHLRVEAYNHYYHGILRGTVDHIARQDTSDNFYLLATIDPQQEGFDLKSGFRVEGDILIKETRLINLLGNKLLKK